MNMPEPQSRYETTTGTALAYVAAEIAKGTVEPRHVISQRLRDRKMANYVASVYMGSDARVLETDAQRRQRDILEAPPRDTAKERAEQKALKLALQQTNFLIDFVRPATAAPPPRPRSTTHFPLSL